MRTVTTTRTPAPASAPTSDAPQTVTSPLTSRPLKAAFQGMATHGYNPRLPERARIYLLGLRKSFKTSFACSNPNAFVLDFEGGANAVMNPRAFVSNLSGTATQEPGTPGYEAERRWLSIPVLQRYQTAKAALLKDAVTANPQFKTIVIDSIDLFIEHLITDFCREEQIDNIGEYGSHGAGYARVNERLIRELQDFEDCGYGLIILAHLGEKTISKGNDSELIIRPRISDSFHKALLMKVDQILHISLMAVTSYPTIQKIVNGKSFEMEDRKNPTTRTQIELRTVPTEGDRERGCRVQIPDRLQLPLADAWTAYADAYNAEVARVKALNAEDPS